MILQNAECPGDRQLLMDKEKVKRTRLLMIRGLRLKTMKCALRMKTRAPRIGTAELVLLSRNAMNVDLPTPAKSRDKPGGGGSMGRGISVIRREAF